MEIKDRIKYLREKKGWSISILAQRAKVGRSTISNIETGRNKPATDVIIKLADAFEVSTDHLLGVDKEVISTSKTKDKELFWQFREIEKLDEKDRETVKEFLDAFLMKKTRKKPYPRQKKTKTG